METTLTTLVCDRCGTEQALTKPTMENEWGLIKAFQHNASLLEIYDEAGNDADICPTCVSELAGWWQGRAAPATKEVVDASAAVEAEILPLGLRL